MEKLSMYDHSRYLGKAQAFKSLGFSEDQVKVAFIYEGLSDYAADAFVKEAWVGQAIGAGLRGIGAAAKAYKGLGAAKTLGRGAGAAAKWGAQGIRRGGMMGKMQGKAGLLAGRTAKNMQAGVKGMQTAPRQTMWNGAKNFGAGAMMMQGKGVAGGLGKATFVSSMMPPLGN